MDAALLGWVAAPPGLLPLRDRSSDDLAVDDGLVVYLDDLPERTRRPYRERCHPARSSTAGRATPGSLRGTVRARQASG